MYRKLFRILSHPEHLTPAIEPLEARIAPATLVNPSTVTFLEKNGETVTVAISKPLFTAASVGGAFRFDTGTVNGSNSVAQQLEMLNIASLGHGAAGLNISITARPSGGGAGVVNVGYINASGIDLADVTVGGDLGRIAAGDLNYTRLGLNSLTVGSLGAQGLSTQLPQGNLNSLIAGGAGSITVNGDIDGASIGIGGGTHGSLLSLKVLGSIRGGAGAESGSVRTQGNIGLILVTGSILGGQGAESGVIGTAGGLGTVLIGGSVIGAQGGFSGAILSTGAMRSAEIGGNLIGGAGEDSGQVGTASALGAATVAGFVRGGAGQLSGTILATGDISAVTIGNGLTGGSGSGAGQIGSGASIGAVVVGGTMTAGAEIHAIGSIGAIQVGATGSAATAISNSFIDAGGNIAAIIARGSVDGSVFIAGTNAGPNFSITGAGAFNNTSAASFGISAGTNPIAAHIGKIAVANGGIQDSTFLAGIQGAGADGKFGTADDAVTTGSSIGQIAVTGALYTLFVESGNIGATTAGRIVHATYISTDSAFSSAGIGTITVGTAIPSTTGQPQPFSNDAIADSTFSSNAGIGNILVSLAGVRVAGRNAGIASSTFLAGHAIGKVTVTDSASGPAGLNFGIARATFNAGLGGYGGEGDIGVALTNAGPNGGSAAIVYSNFDASVFAGMGANMGSVSAENADTAPGAEGILNSVFRVHGNMGPISATMDNGLPTAPAIVGSTFSAFGSIGAINVYGAVAANAASASRFLAGYDIGSDMVFGNDDLSATSLALQAGQNIGNVTVTGAFSGSDIIASVNPGAGYLFGDSVAGASGANDTSVGAGGSIGLVVIGANDPLSSTPWVADRPTSHGIEAAVFAAAAGKPATVSAYGFSSGLPAVLLVDGGPGDVRVAAV